MWSDGVLRSTFNATRNDLLQDDRHPTELGHTLHG
jgi:hypothetical protein